MKLYPILLLFIISVPLSAQNPVVPPGVYMADPAARVGNDGRLYLYCSVDESPDYYCSHRYHMLSTDDMIHWTLHENTFSTRGDDDRVPYNDSPLYAPDGIYRNGKYYLYYCQPDRDHAEGVAVSGSPLGSYSAGKPMNTGPYNQIDPAVFIDDDGTAYYVWGQFTMKMAILKDNMQEIVPGTIRDSVLTEANHFFHEGAFMTKRNGLYYLVFADISRGFMPTCIGYATSESPMGPYTYRGVIIDNDHCDPQCWNNHGSIAEYHGQWFVFYHRSTHNSRMMRKACVEPIFFDSEGLIPEVEMTSQGAGPPLDAFQPIDAARACWMFGHVRIEQVEEGNEALCQAWNNDRAVIKYVDFGKGPDSVSIRVKPGNHDCVIQLKVDEPWAGSIASFNVKAGSLDGEWEQLSTEVEKTDGKHALWIVFYSVGDSGEPGCSLDEIRFR